MKEKAEKRELTKHDFAFLRFLQRLERLLPFVVLHVTLVATSLDVFRVEVVLRK